MSGATSARPGLIARTVAACLVVLSVLPGWAPLSSHHIAARPLDGTTAVDYRHQPSRSKSIAVTLLTEAAAVSRPPARVRFTPLADSRIAFERPVPVGQSQSRAGQRVAGTTRRLSPTVLRL